MIQIVGLFLIAMAVLAILGRFRRKDDKTLKSNGKCRTCGKYRIGKGPCDCGRGKRK